MPELSIVLDRFSFWIGVLTGSLFWFVYQSYREMWPRLKQNLQAHSSELQQLSEAGIEDRLRRETIRRAQEKHISSHLFSLEEILIEPRLLAPVPQVSPDTPIPPDNVVSQTISYIPDWPEFGAFYGVPTLELEAPLFAGLNIAISGQPGCGKSVALGFLATKIARQEAKNPLLNEYLPLLLHINDLPQPLANQGDPARPIIDRFSTSASLVIKSQVQSFLRAKFNSGKVILLLDGIDELSATTLREACVFLERLLSHYPTLRLVTTASTDYWNGLPNPGIRIFALAAWSRPQVVAFLNGWASCWLEKVAPLLPNPERASSPDPLMVQIWLTDDHLCLTPFEWTMLVWAICGGDIKGPRVIDSIEAYLLRLTGTKSLNPIETLAFQMVLSGKLALPKSRAGQYLEQEPIPVPLPAATPAEPNRSTDAEPARSGLRQLPGTLSLSTLLEVGILVERGADSIAFAHPHICGYLAGRALAVDAGGMTEILSQQTWTGKSLSLRYASSQIDISHPLELYVRDPEEPLYRNLLLAARWLKDTPPQIPWRSQVIEQLIHLVQKDQLPAGIRQRALAALLVSEDVSLTGFFRQLLSSSDSQTVQLAALGSGALGDQQAAAALTKLLESPIQAIRNSACLALVALGSQTAMEGVARILLEADEITRRAAAEALANDPIQGHPILKDGSVVGDLLVRRAVVYGLDRIMDGWSNDILEKMRIEDSQWIVRNAAGQVIETRQRPDPYIPRTLITPSMASWLVAFAAKRGMGIPAGGPPTEMLLSALKTGEEEEKLGALDYLRQMHDADVIHGIFDAFFTGSSPVQEAATNALYDMAACGVSLPSPHAIVPERTSLASLRQGF
ncbi:MAG: HEAT repeat domain-containing protein [Anaerolineaceae bacterium]|nr:HEAT repeat domain-containing protein [Anaerolineaceae bacterium]